VISRKCAFVVFSMDEQPYRNGDWIMSLHQPHIRCIVRGKPGFPYEFGPKVVLNIMNGFVHIDEISFDNFNEGQTLPSIVH
jgi:hypothetical protein